MSFNKLGLTKLMVELLEKEGYNKPYPIQQKSVPAILFGKDVLGIAKTGSGKTMGYALPILTNLDGILDDKNRQINVLVLVPTRELAVQVQAVFHQFAGGIKTKVKSMAVYGGVSINPQMKSLYGTHVLVATPGRLLELVRAKAVSLSVVDTLVLDEADKMLSLGFKEEMTAIFKLLPKSRQNLLFSATLSPAVEAINEILLDQPTVIQIEEPLENLELITQTAYSLQKEEKGKLLRYLLTKMESKQVLVFTSSVYQANHVTDKLNKNGIVATAIHSKKSQGARTEALHNFKSGKLKVLVATDLLARGIDIAFLPYVINYELPRSPKDYIHRIGRTGRAENPGEAISFITPEDRPHFKVIQKKMGQWVKLTYLEDMEAYQNLK